nr:MAG TPA: hypothetical protein [Caudoviricetes sp.]
MNDEVKKAWNLFLEHVQKNHEVQKLMKAVGNGTATYAEALEYSSLLSKLLVESASEVYPNDSQKVLGMLKNTQYCRNYFNHVDKYLYDLQSSLNKDSGLGMKPVKMIKYNQLLDQSVSSSDDYKADIEKYKSKAELSANKHVDTYQQYNAKTQNKAGYKVTVSRTYDGVGLSDKRACAWCLERAKSNVPYDEAFKNGMFQRHEGCHCIIEYNNNGEKSYQTSKGGRKSFQKREDFIKHSKISEYEKRWNVQDVTRVFLKENDFGIGTIKAESGFYESKNDHKDEIEVSRWILKKFGGNIVLKKEIDEKKGIKSADYYWDGRLWDLKSPTGNGKRTIDNQFVKIEDQIKDSPGGMILDCTKLDFEINDILEKTAKRIRLNEFESDVIIKKGDKLIAILRKK